MEEGEDIRVRQIMSQTRCNNDFRCLKVGFKNLCCAKPAGGGELVDCSGCSCEGCIRAEPHTCNYRTPFGFGYFCTCPLRIYAAQHPNDHTGHIFGEEDHRAVHPG